MFDKDFGAENESLGGTSVDLGSLDMSSRVSDSWLDVDTVAATSGQIRVRAQWVPCLTSARTNMEGRKQTESCSKAILIVHIKSIHTNSTIEPMVSLQISGENFQTTTKGNSCQTCVFEEEMMLLVKDPDSDWVRFSLFDMNNEAFNAERWFKRGLSVVHSTDTDVLSSDSLAHKGKTDILSRPLVGDLSFPVRMFTEKKAMMSRLRSNTDIEARINFTAKLVFLRIPEENVKCGGE